MEMPFSSGPVTLTMIPTYRCTAACEQCCFGSNPSLRERLTMDEILQSIREAKEGFASLQLVVFSGGEVVMLGEDLFNGVAYAHELGLKTRIVTNGFWGASPKKAKHVARRLRESGLNEINFSTGRDHAQFVSIDAVLTAATAACDEGIIGLITVEQDSENSNIVSTITEDERFKNLAKLPPEKFRFQVNAWMKFNENHKERKSNPGKPKKQNTPCSQLFSNIVVTPHGNISACCGLTFEHIPEMRVGTIEETGLKTAYNNGLNDFMKIWIHTDGPDGVVRKVYDDDPPPELISNEHMCDTCARMHKCEKTRGLIRKRYPEFMADVMSRYALKRIIAEKYTENLS